MGFFSLWWRLKISIWIQEWNSRTLILSFFLVCFQCSIPMRTANIPWSLPLENKSVLLKGQSTDSWRTFRAFKEQTELVLQRAKQTSLGTWSLSALRVSDLKRHEAVLPGRSSFCWCSTSDVFPHSAVDLAIEVAHSCAKNWNNARLLWTIVEQNILTLGLKWRLPAE